LYMYAKGTFRRAVVEMGMPPRGHPTFRRRSACSVDGERGRAPAEEGWPFGGRRGGGAGGGAGPAWSRGLLQPGFPLELALRLPEVRSGDRSVYRPTQQNNGPRCRPRRQQREGRGGRTDGRQGGPARFGGRPGGWAGRRAGRRADLGAGGDGNFAIVATKR
jgi:hypothetical protein